MRIITVILIAVSIWISPGAAALPHLAQQEQQQEKKQRAEDEADEPKTASEEAKNKELEGKVCGSKEVKYTARTDKTQHPTPDPSPDKAIVYVIRPTMFGNKVQTKLSVNGEWKGVNRGNNYFYFELSPGEHNFCSQSENRSILTLSVESGKTYYLQQKIQIGFMKARNKLVVLDSGEGKEGLAKCHLSVAEIKK